MKRATIPAQVHGGRRKLIVHICMGACLLSHVQLFVSPWTVAFQASQSVEFSRQEYWSGLPFPSPGDLPNPGTELTSQVSPILVGGFFPTSSTSGSLI